jgi:hypothetical protein
LTTIFGFSKLIRNVVIQGFKKNLYKFINGQLEYKRKKYESIRNINNFYNIFWFANPSHFYAISAIIENGCNLIDTIYNYNFL